MIACLALNSGISSLLGKKPAPWCTALLGGHPLGVVMLCRFSVTVLVAGLLSSLSAQAQTARGLGGPVPKPRGYAAAQMANAIPTPPRGYRLAWDDDRLNPMRGLGSATGQVQQDQVWTRDIPAKLVTAPQAAVTFAPNRTAVPAMSASTLPAAQSYVQVGTFAQPANAAGAQSRLSALGLPVSTSKTMRKGRVFEVVYAGPFATPAEARSALATSRNAGFSDAILK